jgi:GT2 family glycosyltransferase
MKSAQKPSVYIIVLNWNGWRDTIECVHSLKKLGYPNYHILVIDNASTDESINKIQNEFRDINILQMDKNKGYAGGNNAGIRYALAHGADYIWILNNDTVVDSNALWPLVKKMEENPTIGLCGSLLKDYHHPNQIQALGGCRYYKWIGISHAFVLQKQLRGEYDIEYIERSLDYISGSSMFVSRAFVNSIGLMNDKYFLYYEEIDWAIRNGQTYKLGFAPESIVYHKMHASINAGKEANRKMSKKSDYYKAKSRLMFTRTYYARYLPTVYLTVIYMFIKRLLKGHGTRAVMILKLMFTYNNDHLDDPF